jgi:primosomal protein N''
MKSNAKTTQGSKRKQHGKAGRPTRNKKQWWTKKRFDRWRDRHREEWIRALEEMRASRRARWRRFVAGLTEEQRQANIALYERILARCREPVPKALVESLEALRNGGKTL